MKDFLPLSGIRFVLAAGLVAVIAFSCGTDPRAATLAFSNLKTFYGGNDGAYPYGGLVSSGNTLYGTANIGGSSGNGMVFSIRRDGTGFTNLHSFSGDTNDGSNPNGGLILSGNTLYGTTYGGGNSGNGTVFAIHTDGTGFTNLHNFSAFDQTYYTRTNSDGANPYGGLILSGDTLYGTTYDGGDFGVGTVFAVRTDGTGFATLHSFVYTNDGANPAAGLILSDGVLYGTAPNGGRFGAGTVFAVQTNGIGFTNLHHFTAYNQSNYTNSDGANPYGGLILSGNTLFGTAEDGGRSGAGVVFAIHTDGTGFTNLHSFTNYNLTYYTNRDGASPYGGLLLLSNTLYGTTYGGGLGAGTVFAIQTDGSGFTNLYNFAAYSTNSSGDYINSDGAHPYAGLTVSGNALYGTAYSGGGSNNGAIFSLSGLAIGVSDEITPPSHIVIVIEENHAYGQIIGSSSAPYINSLTNLGALFTNSFAIEHPSQPNYLDLFSGTNQGVADDTCPHTFTSDNLGAQLLRNNLTFVGYSENLPSAGSTVCSSDGYVRKHSPWVNWQGTGENLIPAADNQPFTSFPTDFNQLPTVCFVIPKLLDDMHDGTVAQGDAWLADNLNGYIQWAKTNNSLFILTWDEDNETVTNHIATIFIGQGVKTGTFGGHITHYDVLRTIEDLYGLPYIGQASSATTITDIWQTVPLTLTTASLNDGTNGMAYNQTLAAFGGKLPYDWTLSSGALPRGLSLATNGVFSGVPTATGTYNFSVSVIDATFTSATREFMLTINPSPVLMVTTESLPNGMTGAAYSQTLTASGGQLPYSWAIESGTLPPGLNLAADGTLSGTPTTNGIYNFTVRVTDAVSTNATRALSLSVRIPGAGSAYFQTIKNFHPVAYWPLQEVIPPPSANIETNLGSLGATANAFYESANIQRGVSGAIASDADPAIALNGSNGSWLAVPRLDAGLNLTKANGLTTNGFSVECWFKPSVVTKAPIAILSQTMCSSGFNGSTNVDGWALVIGDGNLTRMNMRIYSGVGTNYVIATKSSGSDADLLNLSNKWFYVVATFTGSGTNNGAKNAGIYINGSHSNTTVSVPDFSPDFYSPIEIGSLALNGVSSSNRFIGTIDEVAIYTNVLTKSQMDNHYTAGTDGSGTYAQAVLNDNPYIYYRMNAPAYETPDSNSYPVALNYGSLGAAMNAVYAPGTLPGLDGPVDKIGLDTNSVGINGLNACVDAGYNNLLDPTGTTPFTVSAWFKLNPGDGNRTETIVGHGSWGLSVSNGAAVFTAGGTTVSLSAGSINANGGANDGNWHMISGTYDGNNCIIQLDSYTNAVVAEEGITGTNLNVLIGGAPDHISVGNDGQFDEQYFPGRIAEVAFFTNALTTAQLQQLYSSATNSSPLFQPTPHITGIDLSGTTLTIHGTNGASGAEYVLMGSTNAALPLSQWTPLLTNYFDSSGNVNLSTNIIDPALPQQLYILELP